MFNIPVFSLIYFNQSLICAKTLCSKKKPRIFLKIKTEKNSQYKLKLGNIDILRDWGYSKEYMEITYKIMTSKIIEDFVIGTGKTVKLRKLIDLFFKKYNLNYKNYITLDKKLFRKFDIKSNYANINKLKKKFKIKPKYGSNNIIDIFYE